MSSQKSWKSFLKEMKQAQSLTPAPKAAKSASGEGGTGKREPMPPSRVKCWMKWQCEEFLSEQAENDAQKKAWLSEDRLSMRERCAQIIDVLLRRQGKTGLSLEIFDEEQEEEEDDEMVTSTRREASVEKPQLRRSGRGGGKPEPSPSAAGLKLGQQMKAARSGEASKKMQAKGVRGGGS